jgi:hypothetical protein
LFCKDFGCLKGEKIVGKYRKKASGDERSALTSMSRKVLRGAWGSYARRGVTIKRANSRGISTHAGNGMCYAGTLRTLPASRSMRILTAVSILALAFASQAAQAQAPSARDRAPQAPAEKAISPEESAARIDAIRQKAEALERSRDEKLKRTTKSICIGC